MRIDRSLTYQRSQRPLVGAQLAVSSADEASDVVVVSHTTEQRNEPQIRTQPPENTAAAPSPAPNVGLHSLASMRPIRAREPQPR